MYLKMHLKNTKEYKWKFKIYMLKSRPKNKKFNRLFNKSLKINRISKLKLNKRNKLCNKFNSQIFKSKREQFRLKFNTDLIKQTERLKRSYKKHNGRHNWPKLNCSKLIRPPVNNLKKSKNIWSKNLKTAKMKSYNLRNTRKRRNKRWKIKLLMTILMMTLRMSNNFKPRRDKFSKNSTNFKTKRMNSIKRFKSKKLL